MSGTLFMKHSCPLPKTADACFLVDIHLKHLIRCPRVFCIYKVQGSCIYYVRYLTLLKNNYFILQKPLSLLWHPEPLWLKIIQNKTQSLQKQNQSNCSIRSLSNPVSNAWESKTAPRYISSFLHRVLAQWPLFYSISTMSCHTALSIREGEKIPTATEFKAPLPAPQTEPGEPLLQSPTKQRGQKDLF